MQEINNTYGPIRPEDYHFPVNFIGWRSIKDFNKTAIEERNGKVRSQYHKIYGVLNQIKNDYGCDPIQVMAYYYYHFEESSLTIQFHSNLEKYFKNIYKDKHYLTSLFSKTFGWKLREEKLTNKGRERLSAATSRQVAGVKEQTKKDIDKICGILLERQKDTPNKQLDGEILGEMKNNELRVTAILKHELDIGDVGDFIGGLITNYSKMKVADGLNLFLEEKGYEQIRVNKARVGNIGK